jgi:hypothetical protein
MGCINWDANYWRPRMTQRNLFLLTLAALLFGTMLVSYVPADAVEACVESTNYSEARCKVEVAR